MFHVKQPNRHKLSEDAIYCSNEAYSAAGKNHHTNRRKTKRICHLARSSLTYKAQSHVGALNKLHRSAFFLGVSRETIGLL